MTKNFENKFSSLNLGKITTTFPIKTISSNGSDKIVAQALFEKQTSNLSADISVLTSENTNCYIVKNKNRYLNFQIKSTDKLETFVIDHGFNENRENRVEAILNGKSFRLNSKTSITDINSVRYQLRNNKQATAFIDNYIFVDNKDKKKYAIYERKQQYLEEQAKKSTLKIQNKSNSY